MTRPKGARGTFSVGVVLYVGSTILGIGCVAFALVSIATQSVPPMSTYRSPASILATVSLEPFSIAKKSAIPSPYPETGDTIGSLSIPVLKQKLPIIEGTGTEELKRGVGHFIQSVMPGEEDNCVLSGHRDTVFRELGKVKIGDQVVAETTTGIYTYTITNIRIVDKDDKTVIVPTDHAVLTLSTCYPFRYVGDAPDRYILTADLVSSE
jgi:sortase A